MKRLDPAKARFLGSRAPGWRGMRARDVLVLTLPLLLLAGALVLGALRDYRRARLFDDWWSRRASVVRAFDERLDAARSLAATLRLRRQLDPETPDPARLRLLVDRRTWGAWQAEPLGVWDQWVDATLVDENDYLDVKIRKRGDTSVHWLTPKKSFTLKTPRRSLYKGFRRLAFSVKTPVEQVVSNGLAGEFDLLAPDTWLAPVYVNKRFYGLFRATELVDESFLRRRHRMPGNVFRADAAERGEVYKGLPRGVFENPVLWERVARNDRPGAAEPSIAPFLLDVAGTTFEDHRRLMGWLDRDEWSRLVAYLLLAGDPYHMSFVHNHFLYEDPTTALLHPIPWDTRLLPLSAPAPDPLNPLLRAVLRDPFVFDGAMRALAERLADDRLLERARALLEPLRERYADALAHERLRDEVIPPPGDPEAALAVLRANRDLLVARLGDARVAARATPGPGTAVLDLLARGWVGPRLRAVRVPGASDAAPLRLVADSDRDGRLGAGDRVVPTRVERDAAGVRLALVAPEALLPGTDPSAWDLRPAPLHYRFFVQGAGAAARPEPELVNPFTGNAVAADAWAEGETIPPAVSWHPWRYPAAPAPHVHRLAGTVHLQRTLAVPAGDTLEIAPGTTIALDPDVSIVARGRVVARGTAERPIRLHPARPRRPWGTLALQGAGASGSVFEHVAFTGGGGALEDRIEYKGMVSAHRARDLRFLDCTFEDNLRSDDMLNVVHGSVSIRDGLFRRANGDGIDFDYSNGEIVHTRVEDARNDAIDLMTSSPRIVDDVLLRSGDKGISVGEGSAPLVYRVRIEGAVVGIEVKDRSEPVILESRVAGNEVGLREYAKNWRYGAGGWAKLVDTPLAANGTALVLEDDSRLTRPGAGDAGAWLRAHFGLDGAPPQTPLAGQSLSWSFASLRDGWRAEGGVTRLFERDGRLSATLPRRRGVVARDVDWTLTEPDRRYLAVLELGGRGLAGGRLRFRRAGDGEDPVEVPLAAARDARDYRFETVELPPGRYEAVEIEVEPADGGGRLDVRGARVYALPARSAARISGATTSEAGGRAVQ